MTKNLIIVALVLITLISLVFAFIKQTEATASEMKALDNLNLAEAAQKEADLNIQEAATQAKRADQLQFALEDCQRGK